MAFDIIPQDQTRSDYRQGATLGDDYKHWFRAKFFNSIGGFFDITKRAKSLSSPYLHDKTFMPNGTLCEQQTLIIKKS
ncbi:type II toxin-antitoxin system YhaV family toxin [Nodularia sp. UHCC 0506]|uniref:type II toxin-antitoxin system YhaV family toxin n=1 Tax=Nodularia sp. UHCC 0506 TaxID=3110243 RepID=UPI002B1ED41D|nr:type II toxin-antitoxin system YhaV family toxin [Nodularia sp. UHCC 0506]MEA5516855.1 type II toxin-antitoxin system YhaV family toxin [Nodularia sp. UHCC 0506]